MQPFSETGYEDIVERYGAGLYHAHRVDLLDELRLLATGDEGPGKKAVLEAGKEVERYVSFLLQ